MLKEIQNPGKKKKKKAIQPALWISSIINKTDDAALISIWRSIFILIHVMQSSAGI